MAHKRSNKRTSFGKKSEAEKSFIKRSKKSSTKDDDTSRRSFSKSPRPFGKSSRSEDSGFERPRRKPEGDDSGRRSYSKPSRPFGKSSRPEDSSFDRPRRRSEGDDRKTGYSKPSRPFGRPRRTDDSQFERPRRKSEGDDKPDFRKPGQDRFEKKPFRKFSDKPFSKPGQFRKRASDRSEGEDKSFEKRSYRKSDEERSSFSKRRTDSGERRPYKSTQSLGFTKKTRSATKKLDEPKKDDGLTRLNKYIANSGMGSRREADEMIKKGLISVNGVTITEMGFKVKPGDEVRYEDRVLKAEKLVYVLLNKPKGFITTTSDPKDRKTVMNLVASACKERLYPVGRLDRNTTGLLLLTNDGELTEKLMHPSYNTKKIYKVELDKPLTKNDFQKIQEGIYFEEGKAIVDDLAYVGESKKEIGIELHIGWNRIVRRIFESLGYEVVKLDRVVFAGLDKKDLPRGEWRFLKSEEVVRLKHFK